MKRNNYCLEEKGIISTKASYYLKTLGFSTGDLFSPAIFDSDEFKLFLKTHKFPVIPNKLWRDHKEWYNIMIDGKISCKDKAKKLKEIESRGNIKKGLWEMDCNR